MEIYPPRPPQGQAGVQGDRSRFPPVAESKTAQVGFHTERTAVRDNMETQHPPGGGLGVEPVAFFHPFTPEKTHRALYKPPILCYDSLNII